MGCQGSQNQLLHHDRYRPTDRKGRVFFAAQVKAPWPSPLPQGRLIPEETRHITLVFLGTVALSTLLEHSAQIPLPSFSVGPAGYCRQLLFLPPHESRVAAASVEWLTQADPLLAYQQQLHRWLQAQYHELDSRPFHPHLSLARSPFDPAQWNECFSPFPFFLSAIQLYESHPELHYSSLWTHPLLPPFEEIEHTADIAFLIRGTSLQELYQHALLSLLFHCPLMPLPQKPPQIDSLDALIIALNQQISLLDRLQGSPFKAVSFHGTVQQDCHGLLNWEMIVDV